MAIFKKKISILKPMSNTQHVQFQIPWVLTYYNILLKNGL